MLLSGCRPEEGGDLVELIPVDAVVVKTVNLQKLFSEAGCPSPVRGGEFAADAAKVVSLVVKPDYRAVLRELLAVKGAVDISEMVCFTTSSGRDVMLFDVGDGALLSESFVRLACGNDVESSDGYSFIVYDGVVAATDGRGHLWIAPDLMTVTTSVASARDMHIGLLDGVSEFLGTDNTVNLALSCGNSALSVFGGRNRWFCVGVKVTGQSVSATGEVIDRVGKADSIGSGFDVIDTDFLRYTPADAAVVLAFGRFDGNVRALASLLGRFAPLYLASADGTTSLSALPVSGSVESVREQTPGSWNVQTMVHVPEHEIEVGLEQYGERAGSGVRDISSSQWAYAVDGAEYYFGAYDGCLLFSTNREISGNYNNGFTDDFIGKRAAMVIDIPAGGVLAAAWGLPYGVTFKFALDAMCWKARVSFSGTDMTAFKALLHMPQLPDIHARYSSMAGM